MFKRRPTMGEVLFSKSSERPPKERETAFWSALRLKNGVYKLTFRDRFADVNDWLMWHLPKGPLEIMDVAASSGITTLELSECLNENKTEHTITAGDLSATCWHVKGPLGEVLLERSGYPLQYDVLFRKALPSVPGTRGAFTTFRVLRFVTTLLLRRPDVQARLRKDKNFKAYGSTFEVKPLMMPEVVENPNVEIVTDDLMAANPKYLRERFDFIRAANILNPDYFNDETLVEIVDRLRERLKPSGLLLIVKTQRHGKDDGKNNATLLKKVDVGWEVVDHFGDGSPIDHLLDL